MPGSTDVFSARILIVDDQESNVRLLEYALRRGGYVAVASTTDPLEVCALHGQNRYDLILLDLQMPRLNGFEVMEGLGKVEGEERVAVLVLTADPSQMVRALEAGARGFLSKPFVLTEVLQRVHLMLEKTVSREIEEPEPLLANALAAFSRSRSIF
jgi:DNA-binding response OmpR family regulator